MFVELRCIFCALPQRLDAIDNGVVGVRERGARWNHEIAKRFDRRLHAREEGFALALQCTRKRCDVGVGNLAFWVSTRCNPSVFHERRIKQVLRQCEQRGASGAVERLFN